MLCLKKNNITHPKFFACLIASILVASKTKAQFKKVFNQQQIWAAYYNQVRFNEKIGFWFDEQCRTNDNLTNGISQNIIRIGTIFYLKHNSKIITGYAFVSNLSTSTGIPAKTIEHRIWQQFQWESKFNKSILTHSIRPEQRFREQVNAFFFNFRIRNNFSFYKPIFNSTTKHPLALIANEEFHFSFGKGFEKKAFDQNRFFLGLVFKISFQNNLQLGYLNIWQNISEGNSYKKIDALRIAFLQNIDLRKSKL